MNYRTPQEVANGVARHPTAAEFQAAVGQFKVSTQALAVFNKQKRFFEGSLKLSTLEAIATARRTITDPVALLNKIAAIQAREANMLSRPYFPFLRYGLHYVQVKDAQGKTEFFRTYERQGLRSAEAVQQSMYKKIKAAAPAGYKVTFGKLSDTAQPFIGLPPDLLEAIQNELAAMPDSQGHTPGLTKAQMDAIEQLRYNYSPASSFAHRFQHKDYVKGYSDDFLRSFSRYSFSFSRYYARTKYGWALRGHIADAEVLGKTGNDNKIGSIVAYMQDHLYNTVLDTKGDFGWAKGAIFHWVFGYSVAGATINASQIPFVTYPFLARRFGGIGLGDARASKAIVKAMAQISNFYKKGSYQNMPAFEMKAINYGVETGRISETQAAELAGLAQGNTLLGQGQDKFRRGLQWFNEKGAWMFEMTEQLNRRVTFRAALELAKAHPNSMAFKEAILKYRDERDQMVQKGTFTEAEANAVITAIHAVEQTQFVYARENRPRFMRGRTAGTVFVFQNYILNLMQLLGKEGTGSIRYLLLFMGAYGLMGLPGAEDLEDLVNIVGKHFFGKDFNVQKMLRKELVEMVGDKADVVLHGLARRGWGIPAIVDLIGEAPGRGLGSGHAQNVPLPVLDRSKAGGMGHLLPINIGKLLDPTDIDKAIAKEIQNASGAAFGVGFNLLRLMMELQQTSGKADPRSWERAMPRALASAHSSYRAYRDERVHSKGGPNGAPTVVNYDPRDTEQLMEVIARAAGYMPLRESARWDLIIAQAEVTKKFEMEQKLILEQRYEAHMGGREEEIERSIEAVQRYNEALPDWARGYAITADNLEQSIMGKIRDKNAKEAGIPVQRRAQAPAAHVQSLFPESTVDVRRVK
jgi:hypothetical protein